MTEKLNKNCIKMCISPQEYQVKVKPFLRGLTLIICVLKSNN